MLQVVLVRHNIGERLAGNRFSWSLCFLWILVIIYGFE